MQEIINQLFPNGFNIEVITNIIVSIYAVIVSLYSTSIKRKVMKSDIQASKSEIKAAEAKKVSEDTAKAVSELANMLLAIFLNANTLTESDKKQLVKYANAIEKLSGIELDENVSKVIDKVKEYNPESTIVQQREKLIDAANKADEVIDAANEKAKELLDKLEV